MSVLLLESFAVCNYYSAFPSHLNLKNSRNTLAAVRRYHGVTLPGIDDVSSWFHIRNRRQMTMMIGTVATGIKSGTRLVK